MVTGADDVAVDQQLALTPFVVDPLVAEPERVRPRTDDAVGLDHVDRLAVEVVHVAEPAVEHLERPAAEHAPEREQHTLGHDAVVDQRPIAVISCERFRTSTATLSGTGAPNGT